MITKKQVDKIREELNNCKKPLFFFHDDPDGLCSFLLLYRYIKEGRGIVVKSAPKLDKKFVRKVEEYNPDKIFVLDIALINQDFIDECHKPIIWIDHHQPVQREHIVYFNPRIKDVKDNTPVTDMCYRVTQQDLWIAMVGIVGDWHIPSFKNQFIKAYPELLPKEITKPEDIIFKTELGKLIRIFSFVLKGKTTKAMQSIKVLTRIKSPSEILEQETAQGKFIYKRYEKINGLYVNLLGRALKKKTPNKLFIFIYKDEKISFTSDISNELLYKFPDKIILIGREKSGEIRMSLRSIKINLLPIVEKALIGTNGYGGGHENACGACVSIHNFKKFLEGFKKGISKVL